MAPRSALIATFLVLTLFSAGCSSNMSRWELVNRFKKAMGHQVERAETADQGSGTASVNGGHTVRRVTIGGSYARRIQVASPGYKANGGLHGNPSN
jgi:hypothetical protein